MPTPGTPPSAIWNGVVDKPLVQDANYRFTATDRAYIDSQILGTQTLALQAKAGSSYFSITQSVTAGGTIASAATAGTGTIVLTGTPSAAFTYALPAGPGQYQIVNNSTQTATVQIGSSTTTLAASNNVLVSTDGTTLYVVMSGGGGGGGNYGTPTYMTFANNNQPINPVLTGANIVQVFMDTSGGACTFFWASAAAFADGTIFRFTDGAPSPGSWGGTHGPPTIATSDSSVIANIASPSTFTTSATMPAFGGASIEYVLDRATSPASYRLHVRPRDGSISTTATGPSATGTLAIVPAFQSNTTAAYKVTCTQTIITAAGSDNLGDTYITSGFLAWKNVSGTVSVIPTVTGLADVTSDSTMTTASFSQNAASIGFTTPSGLNASSVVFIRVTLTPLGVA